MNKKIKVTESELEILKVVWSLNRATTNEITNILVSSTSWNPKTIQTLISRLTQKEVLGIEKINKRTYMYFPLVTEDEYRVFANKSLLNKLYNGSLSLMMSAFIKNMNLSKTDIEQLKKLLDEG